MPLARCADFFADICTALIIEFVPKRDSQVRRLLASRADIFPTYDEAGFEALVMNNTLKDAVDRFIDTLEWPPHLLEKHPDPKANSMDALFDYFRIYTIILATCNRCRSSCT